MILYYNDACYFWKGRRLGRALYRSGCPGSYRKHHIPYIPGDWMAERSYQRFFHHGGPALRGPEIRKDASQCGHVHLSVPGLCAGYDNCAGNTELSHPPPDECAGRNHSRHGRLYGGYLRRTFCHSCLQRAGSSHEGSGGQPVPSVFPDYFRNHQCVPGCGIHYLVRNGSGGLRLCHRHCPGCFRPAVFPLYCEEIRYTEAGQGGFLHLLWHHGASVVNRDSHGTSVLHNSHRHHHCPGGSECFWVCVHCRFFSCGQDTEHCIHCIRGVWGNGGNLCGTEPGRRTYGPW